MARDSNCLFTSIAFNLVSQVEEGNQFIIQILCVCDKDIHIITNIQGVLRCTMVHEWLKNVEYYQAFITVDFILISEQYLEDGQFAGEVGDLMVLTLANVLQHPLVIFTSVVNMPVLCVMPTSGCVNTVPLFLTYMHSGPGHYDYAVYRAPQRTSTQSIDVTKPVKCNCGKKGI